MYFLQCWNIPIVVVILQSTLPNDNNIDDELEYLFICSINDDLFLLGLEQAKCQALPPLINTGFIQWDSFLILINWFEKTKLLLSPTWGIIIFSDEKSEFLILSTALDMKS